MSTELDLSTITGDQLHGLVGASTDDQLRDAVRAVGTGEALKKVFDEMQARFRASSASAVSADVVFNVQDEELHTHHVRIADGTCATGPGEVADPTVALTMPLPLFLRLITGHKDGPSAFMTGQLKIQGDIMLASRLMGFFERPGA